MIASKVWYLSDGNEEIFISIVYNSTKGKADTVSSSCCCDSLSSATEKACCSAKKIY